jgi:hypothetical protein
MEAAMRSFMIGIGTLWAVLVVAIAGALAIGKQQQSSNLFQTLRLSNCGSVCWLDIQPGQTTADDALQKLNAAFETSRPPRVAGHYGERVVTPDFSGRIFQIVPVAKEYTNFRPYAQVQILVAHGIVTEITLSSLYFQNGTANESLPTLGEIMAVLGAPSCVIPFRRLNKLIFNRDSGSIEVDIGADLRALELPVGAVIFHAPNRVAQACASSPRWVGFTSAARYPW